MSLHLINHAVSASGSSGAPVAAPVRSIRSCPRLLRRAARLQESGNVAAFAQPRNLQVDSAGTCVPLPATIRITAVDALGQARGGSPAFSPVTGQIGPPGRKIMPRGPQLQTARTLSGFTPGFSARFPFARPRLRARISCPSTTEFHRDPGWREPNTLYFVAKFK